MRAPAKAASAAAWALAGGHEEAGDQFAQRQHRPNVRLVGTAVQLLEREASRATRPDRLQGGAERDHGRREVAGVLGGAALAHPQHRVPAADALQRGAARARSPLAARSPARVAEALAARPLYPLHQRRGLPDRGHAVRVGGAAAGSRRRCRRGPRRRRRRRSRSARACSSRTGTHPGRWTPAASGAAPVGRREAFDRGHRPAHHDRERQAGQRSPAVGQHRAGAALAVVVANLRPGECEVVAQRRRGRRRERHGRGACGGRQAR
jgi:hypothetical protein